LSDQSDAQVIALAGVFQAAHLVNEAARNGWADEVATQSTLESVVAIDPPKLVDVYGDIEGVKLGLQLVAALLRRGAGSLGPEVVQYVFSVVQATRHLRRRSDVVERLGEELRAAQSALGKDYARQAYAERLAHIYQNTLSTLDYRIKIFGAPQFLQRSDISDLVRALLLGGVRAAWLWHQLGGRRWRLLFDRNRLKASALQLCANMDAGDARTPT
jgi:high frequency lysogenization protein